MIKAKGERNGKPIVVLGLSAENVKCLQADDPILIHGADIDIPHDIMIVFGETDADTMKKHFKGQIGDHTALRVGSPTRAKMRQEGKEP